MDAKRRWIVVSAMGMLALVVLAVAFLWPRGEELKEVASPIPSDINRADDGAADAGYVMIGGVRRKASEVKPLRAGAELNPDVLKQSSDPWDYGKLPAVKADANPQVKRVAEALREKKHPERVSAMIRPKDFDADSFLADPAAYLEVVEPGRVFQTAQPGPGVPRLKVVGPRFQRIEQGQSVTLRISAPAGAPVSFTSFNCGQFENQLTAITVAADETGTAEVRLTATSGTIDDINILAGCPLASGQVKFVVNVRRPARGAVAADGS